ncbi:hypothetical protein [Fontivita pretiosa]|uniref:hypothetical protein n=1 Tax=Fontivita pretiosa TaxID=2989684 RepID=UPI003D1801B3
MGMHKGYEPTNRRPIPDRFRATAQAAVRWCVAAGVHPDLISYASILAAAVAAICLLFAARYPLLLLIAPLLIFLRLWLNMLDGMVALAQGRAGPRGEIINDLPDRISDVLIFTALAHSGLCHPISGYWAAIFALFSAYVGMLGQAVAGKRQFGGIMSKPWRMVALSVGLLATLAMIWFNDRRYTLAQLSLLDWTCLLIIFGCIQTIWLRLGRILRQLAKGG